MFCENCGKELPDGAMFCTGCGTNVGQADPAPQVQPMPQMQPTPQMQPVYQTMEPDEPQPVKKKSKAPILIAAAVVLVLVVVGELFVYDYMKTQDFKEQLATFEEVETQYPGLGDYADDYADVKERANKAASTFQCWKYGDLTDEMDTVESNIEKMNERVAEYREQYDAVVQQIETDGHYIMDDYNEEYQSIKAALEQALAEYDAEACEEEADNFTDLLDEIVAGNKQKADEILTETQTIQTSFSGVDVHPFESYMIGDFVDKVAADQDSADYVQMQADFEELQTWSDKFNKASLASERIESYVQADVSESDRVKLYFNSYNYDEYDFVLQDFEVYENNGAAWDPCNVIDISQIKGALTMDLVADVSSSMWDDFYTMQSALESFANYTQSDTTLGLSTIGSIYERRQEFTKDKNTIINSIWALECNGQTSLYQSLYSSVVYTASAEGARCVVAFTDGNNVPYGSGYDYDAQDVIDVSVYYQVPVYIIGLGSRVNSSELRSIAEATGGEYYDRIAVSDLGSVYTSIYEAQGRTYQLAYETSVSNRTNRDVYVLYADDTQQLSVRFESEVKAEVLSAAYDMSTAYSSDGLLSFYTDTRYLSSDELQKLGDDLQSVQDIINIYYAKNGYHFSESENGQKQLSRMLSIGAITENGTLDGDAVSAILKANSILYQNFSALYNYRYELIYAQAYEVYSNNPGISYEELRNQVNQHFNEDNETRYDPVIKAAWNAIQAG